MPRLDVIYQETTMEEYYIETRNTKVCSFDAELTENIQDIRAKIFDLFSQIIDDYVSINLEFSKHIVSQHDTPKKLMRKCPEPPAVCLSSNEPWTLDQILDKIPDKFDNDELNRFFELKPSDTIKVYVFPL
jgi:hypothetical protein